LEYVEQLGQLIKLPAAQERAYRREALIAGGSHRTMGSVRRMDHGSEFENGEGPAATPHALLQK
jgi:hypothetical protein